MQVAGRRLQWLGRCVVLSLAVFADAALQVIACVHDDVLFCPDLHSRC